MLPPLITPGHLIIKGTLTPASYNVPFALGNGMPLSPDITTIVFPVKLYSPKSSKIMPQSLSNLAISS